MTRTLDPNPNPAPNPFKEHRELLATEIRSSTEIDNEIDSEVRTGGQREP